MKILSIPKTVYYTVGIKLGDTTHYALEGAAFIGGAAVQWLRDGLQMIQSAPEIEAMAETVESSGDGVRSCACRS